MIRNLTRAGAKVIAYDVQFTEPDPDHPQDDDLLIEAVRKQPKTVMATTEVDRRTARPASSAAPWDCATAARIPSNSNYNDDSDGRIRHVTFRIQKLETFPIAAARAYNGGHLQRAAGQQRVDRLQG